jgi:class 3 adenylate cyclase
LNVAARLQRAAQPGEVLIAEETLALVGSAIEVERVEPLVLKGRASRFRLRLLLPRTRCRPATRRGVRRRERELALLAGAWARR